MTAYKVTEGTQVHYDGKTYEGGETVPYNASDDQALIEYQVNAGWLEKTDGPARQARTRKASN